MKKKEAPAENPLAAMMAGMGGGGGGGGGGMPDMNAMMGMMQNPAVQQMVSAFERATLLPI